ncbi:hypothetical protein THYS13_12870 [Thermoanaerobacter sp. YS13]|uniref:DUF5673 domain-containing protein n=1 Tax=Thermoanaerobacter sp. YS13 TaxID=1511746 RepID=UPI0005751891|nr:DUF5673 domain-containing protein [Thermoanaerobacter sp. YS13]KHO63173.1 hypothetical protein THYS13_12870 [Thermoanaerobacter sp. YS13]
MNKNKKVIIATFIFALAIIIGLLEGENILQNFFSVLLVLVIFATIWDVFNVVKAKKDFGQTKWNIKTNNNSLVLAISMYVILIAASINANLKDTLHIKFLAMAFIGWIAYLVRSLIPNGINEKGIMHWGVFHTLDNIDSYSFTDKYLVITLKPNNKKITFIVDKDKKEIIKNFLKEKLKKQGDLPK